MTNRQIENRIRKIQTLEEQVKILQDQIDGLKDEIKISMESDDADEIRTGSFIVRWKEVISRRLDGTALKKALPDVWQTYSKDSSSRRFTITAA